MYDPMRKRWLLYCRPPMYSSGRDMTETGTTADAWR